MKSINVIILSASSCQFDNCFDHILKGSFESFLSQMCRNLKKSSKQKRHMDTEKKEIITLLVDGAGTQLMAEEACLGEDLGGQSASGRRYVAYQEEGSRTREVECRSRCKLEAISTGNFRKVYNSNLTRREMLPTLTLAAYGPQEVTQEDPLPLERSSKLRKISCENSTCSI